MQVGCNSFYPEGDILLMNPSVLTHKEKKELFGLWILVKIADNLLAGVEDLYAGFSKKGLAKGKHPIAIENLQGLIHLEGVHLGTCGEVGQIKKMGSAFAFAYSYLKVVTELGE